MMSTELQGKVALITGSSSGIGEAIAYRLARDGATVIVHGRNAERARRVAETIRSEGGKASVVLGDLTDVAAANAVIQTIFSEYPDGIDILFNNAGGDTAAGPNATWFDVSPEEWLGTYDFNVLPAVRMIHAFAPMMRKRGWGAHHPGQQRRGTSPHGNHSRLWSCKRCTAEHDTQSGKGTCAFRSYVELDQPGPDSFSQCGGLAARSGQGGRMG